jgi:hypothetical protein
VSGIRLNPNGIGGAPCSLSRRGDHVKARLWFPPAGCGPRPLEKHSVPPIGGILSCPVPSRLVTMPNVPPAAGLYRKDSPTSPLSDDRPTNLKPKNTVRALAVCATARPLHNAANRRAALPSSHRGPASDPQFCDSCGRSMPIAARFPSRATGPLLAIQHHQHHQLTGKERRSPGDRRAYTAAKNIEAGCRHRAPLIGAEDASKCAVSRAAVA